MRKILIICVLCVVMFSLISCGEYDGNNDGTDVYVNYENSEALNSNVLGIDALVKIGNGLYYDSTTGIVYWWNGVDYNYSHAATTPSPYYAPNGLPYRYNPETNTLVEIKE